MRQIIHTCSECGRESRVPETSTARAASAQPLGIVIGNLSVLTLEDPCERCQRDIADAVKAAVEARRGLLRSAGAGKGES